MGELRVGAAEIDITPHLGSVLAGSLGLDTVAEGVEDAGQALVTQAPAFPVLAHAHPALLRQAARGRDRNPTTGLPRPSP